MPSTTHIRNIGIIAHIDAGKTTLSERMLFYSKKIHRMGEVHDGAATMDFLPEEQERGITITSACTTCRWRDCVINLVDTPGHVDFTIEVERTLRVLDGAVGVFCAVGGVEPQSETVWRQSEIFRVPKIAFVNKMDRPGANFAAVLEGMRRRLNANPVPITAPLHQGEGFDGIVDLVSQEKLAFDPADQGATVSRETLTEKERDMTAPWREMLLEKLAEADDVFLELWLNGAYGESDIRAALRRGTLARALTPVLCGAALRNTGIQPVLDAVCDYLPSPNDISPAVGHDSEGKEVAVSPDPQAPAVALVFKILMETGHTLSFIRLYAGTVREGDILCNCARKTEDRVSRIYRLHADRRERTDQAGAGEIVAVAGLRSAHTGETYASPGHVLLLEAIDTYEPVITLAVEPLNADEGKTLDEALARYAAEDPTLRVALDEDSGARMVSGMGELHLEILFERMRREYKISPRTGKPQVVLRETIREEAAADVTFDKEFGKERHQGRVSLRVASLPRHSQNQIRVGDFLPEDPQEARKLLPTPMLDAALEGIADALQSGPTTGWPVVDVLVTLTGVTRQEGLTTVPGCRMAAGMALREALSKASPMTLEPIMRMEINIPDEFIGASISLINSRQGNVEDLEDREGQKILRGTAPLRQLFGFATALRSASQGRAGLTLSFDRFDLP